MARDIEFCEIKGAGPLSAVRIRLDTRPHKMNWQDSCGP